MSIIDLLEQRTLIDTQICIKTGGSSAGMTKMTKAGKPKSSRKGKPTCNGDFMKKICAEQKSAVEEFKKANPDQKGAHLVFLANYKKEHDEEWKTYQSEWKESHPKESNDKDGSISDAVSATSATGSEKKRVLTPEHLAKMKAGREAANAAKAAKAAPADTFVAATVIAQPMAQPIAAPSKPVKKVKAKKAEPIVEPVAVISATNSSNASVAEDAPEELPFKHGGVTYIRLGNKREDGTYLWATGDLWANKKGSRGGYIGAIQDDGSIDKDALEPLLE